MSDESFSAEDAAKANRELRRALGLPPQEFGLEQFVGMISDEIEQLRSAGKNDAEISRLLHDAVNVDVSADSIARYYASPDERRFG